MRTILRAILAVALLLGSGLGDWAPAVEPAHESCCCGMPASAEDTCPCPKPEGNRAPSQTLCQSRAGALSLVSVQRTQAQRRVEPRPMPATWLASVGHLETSGLIASSRGRDPDLGRHLARLSTFRI